MAQIEPKCMAL